jgi:hypothetical protein
MIRVFIAEPGFGSDEFIELAENKREVLADMATIGRLWHR